MTSSIFGSERIRFSEGVAPDEYQEGYYEGQFLIATPAMTGELFSQSLIYIFAHNAGGAMGVMLNKSLDMVHYSSLCQQLGLELDHRHPELNVYHGGPVEENRGFIVHSGDYCGEDTLDHECGISVSASMTVLRDVVQGKGPQHAMLVIGYAGWAAGQLESEIESNYWVTAPATPEVAFHPDNEARYALAAKTLGVDMLRFSPVAGHA